MLKESSCSIQSTMTLDTIAWGFDVGLHNSNNSNILFFNPKHWFASGPSRDSGQYSFHKPSVGENERFKLKLNSVTALVFSILESILAAQTPSWSAAARMRTSASWFEWEREMIRMLKTWSMMVVCLSPAMGNWFTCEPCWVSRVKGCENTWELGFAVLVFDWEPLWASFRTTCYAKVQKWKEQSGNPAVVGFAVFGAPT